MSDEPIALDPHRVSIHLKIKCGPQPEWRFTYYKVEGDQELLHLGQPVHLDATEFGGPVVEGWIRSVASQKEGPVIEQLVTVVGYDE